MKFVKSNMRKLYLLVAICCGLLLGVFLCSYLKPSSAATTFMQCRFFLFSISMLMLLYYLAGVNTFYIRDKLFFRTPENSITDVFDDKNHSLELKNENNFFLFTEQRLKGYISGFPVVVSIFTAHRGFLDIEFSVHKTAGIYAGKDRKEKLTIHLATFHRLKADVKSEVLNFVAIMESHGDIPSINKHF